MITMAILLMHFVFPSIVHSKIVDTYSPKALCQMLRDEMRHGLHTNCWLS